MRNVWYDLSSGLRGGSIQLPGPSSPTFIGTLTIPRIAGRGTALAITDIVLSSGWGTSPVKAITGSDAAGTVTITAKATVGASPTITLTFKDGTWTTIPVVLVDRTDVSAATAAPGVAVTNRFVVTSVSATQMVITFNGTPVANNVYSFSFICIGT